MFSLDTLVNMPRLLSYAMLNAAKDSSAANELTRESFLELLAQTGCDLRKAVENVCGAHEQQFMGQDYVTLDFLRDSEMFGSQWSKYLEKCKKAIGRDAGKCVKAMGHLLLSRLAKMRFDIGVFYPMDGSAVKRVVAHAPLAARISIGYKTEPPHIFDIPWHELEAELGNALCSAEESWLVVPAGNERFKKLAERSKTQYVECSELYQAPIASLHQAMNW